MIVVNSSYLIFSIYAWDSSSSSSSSSDSIMASTYYWTLTSCYY